MKWKKRGKGVNYKERPEKEKVPRGGGGLSRKREEKPTRPCSFGNKKKNGGEKKGVSLFQQAAVRKKKWEKRGGTDRERDGGLNPQEL